jgi:hypothetical protein
MAFAASPLKRRSQFGAYLNFLGLTGEAAEVGTHRGEFAAIFLDEWMGRLLYCVDAWSEPLRRFHADVGMPPVLFCKDVPPDRQTDYDEALTLRDRFPGRVQIVRALSTRASRQIRNGQLDFVYIDGDHEAESVKSDLKAWWPKLKAGGIMAGHDFKMPHEPDDGWGRFVRPAVASFVEVVGDRPIYMVSGDESWSFYFFKHGDER